LAEEDVSAYGAMLNFSEKDGLRHYYHYDHSQTKSVAAENSADRVQARVIYKITADLEVQGGVDYSVSEHDQTAPFTSSSKLNSGSVLGGIAYRNRGIPVDELPFALSTNYDFTMGFADLSSGSAGVSGRGLYYINAGGVGLSSTGWQFETLGLTYNVSSKRDDSPIHNDSNNQNITFNFSSSRLRNTRLSIISTYSVFANKADAGTEFMPNTVGVNQENRQFIYDANASYTVTTFLSVQAGAGRSEQSAQNYTLSTLGPAPGGQVVLSNLLYAQADFNYAFTRNMIYRAALRDEKRKSLGGVVQNYQVNMDLDYRIRSIFLNTQYRWRKDAPQGGLKSEQQYVYVKLSRPF
jgi:hypothetical protein